MFNFDISTLCLYYSITSTEGYIIVLSNNFNIINHISWDNFQANDLYNKYIKVCLPLVSSIFKLRYCN